MEQPSYYAESVTTPSAMGSSDGTGADSSSVISEEQIDRRRGVSGYQSTEDQLNKLTLMPSADSWHFDITELLDSQTYIPPENPNQRAGNNFKNYDAKKSIFVLCVIGSLDVHTHLLCDSLHELTAISTNIQALIVTDRIEEVKSRIIPSLSVSLPALETSGTPPNHFLKLGLLRPNDLQNTALDAIVLIDPDEKRRLVLPFGWGAGKYVTDQDRGKRVLERMAAILKRTVKELVDEKTPSGVDFYDIARTYF